MFWNKKKKQEQEVLQETYEDEIEPEDTEGTEEDGNIVLDDDNFVFDGAEDMTMEEAIEDAKEPYIVTFDMADGSSLDYEILGAFLMDNTNYMALSPLAEGSEENEVHLFRFVEGENGEVEFQNIDDDMEYEMASIYFRDMVDDLDEDDE